MTFPVDVKITTETLLIGALVFAVLDALLLPLLAWRIPRERFVQSRWALAIVTAVFWFSVWSAVLAIFWDTVYSYVFPAWMRPVIPPVYGAAFGGLSLGFWWLAQRGRFHPVIVFCLLGGGWGIVTHILAVQLGIVTNPPVLQGASPVAAVVIAAFEFTFYWCIITAIGTLAQLAAGQLKRMFAHPG